MAGVAYGRGGHERIDRRPTVLWEGNGVRRSKRADSANKRREREKRERKLERERERRNLTTAAQNDSYGGIAELVEVQREWLQASQEHI